MCFSFFLSSTAQVQSPFSHCSYLLRTSTTLDKNSGEVLPLSVEDNQPQDGYYGCEGDATVIQEDVIQKDVPDYRSQHDEGQGDEPVDQQQCAADDLQTGDYPIVVRQKQRAYELACQSRGRRPQAKKTKKAI